VICSLAIWFNPRTLEELLFKLSLGDLDLDGLVDLLLVSLLVVRVVLDGRGKEGVDECGLAQPGLASNLKRWMSEADYGYEHKLNLTMMVKAAPLLATILCRWLGRLAIPIGEALSALAGAILKCRVEHEVI